MRGIARWGLEMEICCGGSACFVPGQETGMETLRALSKRCLSQGNTGADIRKAVCTGVQ